MSETGTATKPKAKKEISVYSRNLWSLLLRKYDHDPYRVNDLWKEIGYDSSNMWTKILKDPRKAAGKDVAKLADFLKIKASGLIAGCGLGIHKMNMAQIERLLKSRGELGSMRLIWDEKE